MIKYQDKSIQVSYIQIFLKEYFGLSLNKIISKNEVSWEISSNNPIKVTGYWNTQSYSSLALYMAYHYPKERYPVRWYPVETDPSVWKEDDSFEYDPDNPDEESLINIISNNIINSSVNPITISVPSRVLSYILDEVVTPLSSDEEILRIKTLIYDSRVPRKNALVYDQELINKVSGYQQQLINKYTLGTGVVELPEQYTGFKVTGYVDPWTERYIKEMVNNGDS